MHPRPRGKKESYLDSVKPQRDVFAGHTTTPSEINARAATLGFDAPLPTWVERFADKMRLHTPDYGKPFLMHQWGEMVHPLSAKDLSPGGVKLPAIRVPSDELRVFILGDSGTNNADQSQVADTFLKQRADDAKAPHFAIHVGDGFYNNGVTDAKDPKFKEVFDDYYGAFDRPIYYALGNHDYGDSLGSGNPDAFVEYSVNNEVTNLTFPERYFSYSYEFGKKSARFFTLDTNTLLSDPKQLEWLKEELSESSADFNIIVGHHPILSDGSHGDQAHFQDALLPLVDKYADIYVCGHEHDQQLMLSQNGAPFLRSGAAGEERDVGSSNRSLFSAGKLGFASLNFSDEGINVSFVDDRTGGTVFETLLQSRSERQRETLPKPKYSPKNKSPSLLLDPSESY
ncbi:MAG: hypothetical protein GY822_21235 [Deltaproteobacteria bacterium]|nr:hypothetical protein [Deltaproteobacteria bacterium]